METVVEANPWELKVVLEPTVTIAPGLPPNLKFWDRTIERLGKSMKTQFASMERKPSEEEALGIIGDECRIADLYNTPELFKVVFDSLYNNEPDMVMNTFNDMQDLAKRFKEVLGPDLYAFYTLDTETTVPN